MLLSIVAAVGLGACAGLGSGGSTAAPTSGAGNADGTDDPGGGDPAPTGTGGGLTTGDPGGTGAAGTGAIGGGPTGTAGSGSTGTGAGDGISTPGTAGGGGVGMPGTGTGGITSGMAGATGAAGTTGAGGSTPPNPVQPGLLTAGAWDDNLNFDFYLAYLTRTDGSRLPGLPLIPRANRLEIRVSDAAGAPLGGVKVTVSDATGKLLEAPTRSDGRLFFFPEAAGGQGGDDLQISAAFGAASATVPARVGDATVAVSLTGATASPPRALDLALVIDTTGSMQDEIDYLKAEVSDIAARIARDFPGVMQRWALILYRDVGDAYVLRSYDFTESLPTFQAQLAAQMAGGGGDYPEAPDQALAKLTTLTFNPDAVARMAFWIADAPHHVGYEPAMVKNILDAQRLGIHLYPVAASGSNDLVEYTMRTAAEVTGGRYLFLTDDSGIGGSHQEPTIPCYFVTTLGRAMVRMAAMELTGTQVEVAPADVIRTAGDPEGGRCTLAGGTVLQAL
jgi:hypothetical protein